MLLNTRRAFTLTELIIVMGLFMSVLLITASAFKTVLTQSGKHLKSAETQLEGIVGLDLFRFDLQQAGYGLPRGYTDSRWLYQVNSTSPTISYTECTADTFNGVDPKTLNDAPSGIPRAVLSVNDAGVNGSDYLVIKSTVSGVNDTARKWTYLNYTGDGGEPRGIRKIWNPTTDTQVNLVTSERVVVIRSFFLNQINYKQLVVNGSGFFTTVPGSNGFFPTNFSPQSSTDTFLVYGVHSTTNLSMPFNRTDYFVSTTSTIPASCASNTGVLYKAVVNQSDGNHLRIPLLDCVANLQVVYSVATNGDNNINFHYNASMGGATLDILWNQLREIRVYILAQDGRKDSGYIAANRAAYPNNIITVGEFGLGRDINMATTIGAGWDSYRWKIYTIVVQPKNLN